MTSDSGMSWLARFASSSSQFANKRGIYLGRRSTKIHVALYRWSGGKLGGHFPGLPEARILLMNHTGANSGARRTSPLMYHEDGNVVVVAGVKGWPANASCVVSQPKGQPGYHDSDRLRDSRRSSPPSRQQEERDRLWPKFVAFYPGYHLHERNARIGRSPIVILDPR